MGGEYANRNVSNYNTYDFRDARYWDGRYLQEVRPFDWYQRYSALRPFVNKHIPKASRLLMLGCRTAVMSEDMKKDGYEYIMNIDFSSVAIYMMEKKNEHVPQLEYMQMNVTDMSFFSDESFDSAIDKAQPGFEIRSTSSPKSILEPVPLMEDGLPPPAFMLENPASCYVYVCEKGEAACLPTDS